MLQDLPQANLVKKTDFDNKVMSLNRKLTQRKKHLLVENELKNYKRSIQFILTVKVILKKTVLKII